MKILRLAFPLVAATLLLSSGAVRAQGGPPGAGGPGGGGGFQMSPEMKKAMEDMKKWRDSHKNFQQIGMTVRTVSDFEKDPKTALTKDQAKKVWGLISPWTSKPTMTDAQAKTVNDGIVKVFTVPQIKKLAAAQKEMQGRMRGMGGGGGAPGGGGAAGGGRPGGGGGGGMFDPARMKEMAKNMTKEYNPLNTKTYPDTPWKDRIVGPMETALKAIQEKGK